MLSKITPVLEKIGWEQLSTDSPVIIILRSQLLDWACSLGSSKCNDLTTSYIIALADEGNPYVCL